MRSTFSAIFLLRKNRVSKDGLAPVDLAITVNKERVKINTGKKIDPTKWDQVRQKVKGNSDEAKLLNECFAGIKNKLLQCEIDLTNHGFIITSELLRDAYLNNIESLKEKSFFDVFNEHNEQQKALIGNGISKSTYFVSEYTHRLAKDFLKNKFKRDDIYLRELNVNFIKEFHIFLLEKMGQNSCSKHLKLLKKIINIAVANSYMTFNPFAPYKVQRNPFVVEFLTEDELQKVIAFETPLPRLERAKDMFLFGCFTGLAYIDIKTLTKDNFITDDSGRIWIKKVRVKTNVLSTIPLLPMAQLILEKYKDENPNKLLPIQDPADINKYLKDIAILCRINKRITFHTSRHTFASTVTLANNISLEVVAKMMGHTTTRMTSHYAKLVDNAIAKQMDEVMDLY